MKLENGLLLIDKPSGMTSHDVVNRVRKAFGTRAVGHAGTLDPFASGLLVLLIGQATKLSDYILTADKAYMAKVRLGQTSDTLDRDGQILTEQEVSLSLDQIRSALLEAQGVLELPVPKFSAIKVNGKKLYDYARADKEVEVPVRPMEFKEVRVDEVGDSFAWVLLRCTKGSYIRSWAAYVGERLGVGGLLEELRRVGSQPYHIERAIGLTALEELAAEKTDEDSWAQTLPQAFIPLELALPDWKALTISGRDERLLRNGQISHDVSSRLLVEQKEATRLQAVVGIKVISSESKSLLGLLEARPGQGLKIRRIFNH